jgi:hypothetical protein
MEVVRGSAQTSRVCSCKLAAWESGRNSCQSNLDEIGEMYAAGATSANMRCRRVLMDPCWMVSPAGGEYRAQVRKTLHCTDPEATVCALAHA